MSALPSSHPGPPTASCYCPGLRTARLGLISSSFRVPSSQSTATNKSRLRVLQARESHLQELFDAARGNLSSVTQDQAAYTALLQKLILQGLLQLMEPEVAITARSADVQLVQGVLDGAAKDYAAKTGGRKVKLSVSEGLEKDSAGGILLAGLNGRIKVNNTLDERLRLIEDKVRTYAALCGPSRQRHPSMLIPFPPFALQMLPEIRLDLFGPNENRKWVCALDLFAWSID